MATPSLSPPSSVNCTRCTMSVNLKYNGLIGNCSTCESWYCPSCTRFSLQMSKNCLECGKPRPVVPSSSSNPTTATSPTPPKTPPPSSSKGFTSLQYQNYHPHHASNPMAQTNPVILEGQVVSPAAAAASVGPVIPKNNHHQQNNVFTTSTASGQRNTATVATISPIRTADEAQYRNNNNNNIPFGEMARQHSNDNTTPSTTTTTTFSSHQNQLLQDINRIRETCRAAKTPFVDCFNPDEFKRLEWGSISSIPGENNNEPLLKPKNDKGDNKWVVFPPEGPRPSHISQNNLGTCWLLSAASVLAGVRPDLIEAIFPVREVNPEGVFAVRLWTVGKFETLILDSSFPIINRRSAGGGGFFSGNSGRVQKADFQYCSPGDGRSLWPCLLEKSFAKLYSSFAAISSGTVAEAFYSLTGFPCIVTHLGEKEWDEKEQKTPEEVFQILHSFSTSSSTMGASCGGSQVVMFGSQTVSKDDVANNFKLRSSHAYAILNVTVCSATKRKLIQLRDPWGRTETTVSEEGPAGFIKPQNHHQNNTNTNSGEFWMGFDQFMLAFSNVTTCLTRPFSQRLVAAAPAVCVRESSFLPKNFAEACIMFQVHETCQVFSLVAQPEIRVNYAHPEKCNGKGFFDAGGFLLRLPFPAGQQNNNNSNNDSKRELPTLVTIAGSRNLRVAWSSHVCDPGTYIFIPFSFQQHKAPNKEMTSCILNEKSNALTPVPFPANASERDQLINFIVGTSNRWLFSWLSSQKSDQCQIKHATQTSPWSTYQTSIGENRVIAIASFGSRDTSIAVDATSNTGVTHPGREETAGTTNLVLPASHVAIIYWSISEPYGSYYEGTSTNTAAGRHNSARGHVISNGAAWQMKEVIGKKSNNGLHLNRTSDSSIQGALKQFFGFQNQSSSSSSGGKVIDPRSLGDEDGLGFENVPVFMKPFRML